MKVAFLRTKSAVVLWDVERMIRDMKDRRLVADIRSFSISNLSDQCGHVDYDVSKSNMDEFPIVVFLARDKYRVLVGEEQICKAKAHAFRTIACYTFQPRQHKRYIVDYDEETYRRAVEEYWADECGEDEEE